MFSNNGDLVNSVKLADQILVSFMYMYMGVCLSVCVYSYVFMYKPIIVGIACGSVFGLPWDCDSDDVESESKTTLSHVCPFRV